MVLDYIKSTIEILMNIKLNDSGLQASRSDLNSTLKSEDLHRDPTKEYEAMLRQMEGETREHISVP